MRERATFDNRCRHVRGCNVSESPSRFELDIARFLLSKEAHKVRKSSGVNDLATWRIFLDRKHTTERTDNIQRGKISFCRVREPGDKVGDVVDRVDIVVRIYVGANLFGRILHARCFCSFFSCRWSHCATLHQTLLPLIFAKLDARVITTATTVFSIYSFFEGRHAICMNTKEKKRWRRQTYVMGGNRFNSPTEMERQSAFIIGTQMDIVWRSALKIALVTVSI